MKALFGVSVVFVFLVAGCSREQSVAGLEQELGRARVQVERLTERVEKLEHQPGTGKQAKELAEIELRITALKAESEVLDKQMAEVISILDEWAHTHREDIDRAAKADTSLALKLVAASGKLADERLKDLTKARVKYRAEVEQIWKEYQTGKKK